MCKRTKKLRFKWELGDEMVSLHVNQYAYDGRLHIGMINYGEDGPEPFADMTINLPAYDLEDNEAFINGDISKDLLRFIRENKLGKVLPYTVKSGYGRYAAVASIWKSWRNTILQGLRRLRKTVGYRENSNEKRRGTACCSPQV